MRATIKQKKQQIALLEQHYSGAKPALHFTTIFELLVAVILSAQCTDKRVNLVTERLFQKANTAKGILELGVQELENEIRECGFYHNKAKNILATCQILCNQYGGEVPESFEELQKLPGVGRKTANVVMSVGFHYPAIAVDTHVFRVSNRLGLAVGKNPLEVEENLKKILPKEKWSDAHHWLIWHGRNVCKALKPRCKECVLQALCCHSLGKQ